MEVVIKGTNSYDARARFLLSELAATLNVSRAEFELLEATIAWKLGEEAETTAADGSQKSAEEVQAEREKQKKSAKKRRWLAVGLGTVVGGVVIGVTGGLAAPLVAAGAGAVFGGGAGAAFATTAGIYTIGTLFAAGGGGLVAHKTNKRFGKLAEFRFIDLSTIRPSRKVHLKLSKTGGGWTHITKTPLAPKSQRRQSKRNSSDETEKGSTAEGEQEQEQEQGQQNLHVVINVNGWIPTRNEDDDPLKDFTTPWLSQTVNADTYALVWESKKLHTLAVAVTDFMTEQLAGYVAKEVLKKTVFASLMAAVALPAVLAGAASVIDNPWGVCLSAAKTAGIELAHALLDRVQGTRPVTLVGSSFGALVIFEALKHMSTRKHNDGLVYNVFLFGAPLSGSAKEWEPLSQLVSGQIVNCISKNDWVLKMMVRGVGANFCVAGLDGINLPRVSNINMSPIVSAHGDWLAEMPRLLGMVGLQFRHGGVPRYGCVGRRVQVSGHGSGILRYYGWLRSDGHDPSKEKRRPEWCGVSLDNPLGDCDGSHGGKSYFACRKGYGIFVKASPDQITLVSNEVGLEAVVDASTTGVNATVDESRAGGGGVRSRGDVADSGVSAVRLAASLSLSAGTPSLYSCYSPACRADPSSKCYSVTKPCGKGFDGAATKATDKPGDAFTDDLDDCMLAPTPADDNMEPVVDNGEEVRTFEPGQLHNVVYSAHVESAERFLVKPNVFSIKVFALEETRAVKATLDDFEALSKQIRQTLGKDSFPKRMLFSGTCSYSVVYTHIPPEVYIYMHCCHLPSPSFFLWVVQHHCLYDLLTGARHFTTSRCALQG